MALLMLAAAAIGLPRRRRRREWAHSVPRLRAIRAVTSEKKNPGASVLKLALRALGDPGARCRTGSPACAARWGLQSGTHVRPRGASRCRSRMGRAR